MGCNLDKFTTYHVKDVVRAGNRNVVHFSEPIATCPDGTLNNSRTEVKHVDREGGLLMTLSWSERLERPVVIVPTGYEVAPFVDPAATADLDAAAPEVEAQPERHLGIAAGLSVAFLLIMVVLYRKMSATPATKTGAPMRPWETYAPPASSGTSAAVASAAVGAAAGYVAGRAFPTPETEEAARQRRLRERQRRQDEANAAVTAAAASTYSPPAAAAYDSGSSYSPSSTYDSGSSSSSYGSDSGSSYSSDSGSSSFGSD